MATLRAGLIGLGMMGRHHARLYATTEGSELVGVVDGNAERAAGRAEGGACASDAFFPFRDGLDAAAAAGIATVIQPGGSVRDDEVIAAADEHGIAMVFTGQRHFRH